MDIVMRGSILLLIKVKMSNLKKWETLEILRGYYILGTWK